ncbi:MAG: aminotransferase class I/II-fold pyridoxal phosphate-dependent enzyme [Butyrivibrio sp.]|nr:aminotransferase class I/II-fold pyridoxal phosphate-dependent enzyme [Butyrivibrio sp.]
MVLRDLLINRAKDYSQKKLYLVENDVYMSYRELYIQAKKVSRAYRQAGAGKGDLILIQSVEPIYTFMGFWGAILIGAIPALYPINADLKQHIPAITALCRDFEINYIYSDMVLGDALGKMMEQKIIIPGEYEKASDSEGTDYSEFKDISIYDDDTAVLQFSSGSTGNPKGVLLTNKNVVSNAFATADRIDLTREDNVFNWLPLSHDFAILAMHMCPIAFGCDQICMKPTTFLRSPSIWAKIATQEKATFSPMPNFAMNLIIKTFEKGDYEAVDLSGFKGAVSAGEGVSVATCDMFVKVLSPYGFKDSAVIPAYGLAEATVTVSLGNPKEEREAFYVAPDAAIGDAVLGKEKVANARLIIGCGRLIRCNDVFICDDDFRVLEDGHIGNILVSGDNVTKGYYKNEDATRDILRPNGDLVTGDIGFICDGQLFISGRRKEMIIVNGRNYFSSDIEMAVRSTVKELAERSLAAFGVHDSKEDVEKLYIAVESTDPSDEKLSKDVANAVVSKLHIPCERVVFLPELPKTASGKIRYYLLTRKFEEEILRQKSDNKENAESFGMKTVDSDENAYEMPSNKDEDFVLKKNIKLEFGKLISEVMEGELSEDDYDRPFAELGIDSLGIESLLGKLEKEFGVNLTVDVLWSYPTINKMVDYLKDKAESFDAEETSDESRPDINLADYMNDDIAIVSMACHFPKEADSPKKFWEMLCEGKDAIDYPDENRIKLSGNEGLRNFKAGYIKDIDKFDSRKYGITPKEAIKMDPQQRLLLKTASELFVNSGKDEKAFEGTDTGVYIGVSNHDYASLFSDEDKDLYYSTGNSSSIMANRLSYVFNLSGPSVAIDTACSSSLVALHMAAGAIRNGECKSAICGGVNILLEPVISEAFKNAGMLSPDSKCKTCDETANGYVRGEGCGLVLLKKYSDAVKDGDTIYAVVAGSAVNQDAKSNGLTAPSGKAQENVIKKALDNAGVMPGDVDYIELHGTGTKLGDPIELNSIGNVFADSLFTNDKEMLVGSVKTNIGHLESAAGIAGVIKATMILAKGEYLESINYNRKNPYIKAGDNIKVATKENITGMRSPEVAGISSFGFGGTNCHVVLKAAGRADIDKLDTELSKGESYFIEVRSKVSEHAANGMKTGSSERIMSQDFADSKFVTVSDSRSVLEIVKEALSKVTAYPVDTLNDSDRLMYDLGIDSIMMGDLVSDLSSTFSFGKEQVEKLISLAAGESTTIADLVSIIEKAGGNVPAAGYSESSYSEAKEQVDDFETYESGNVPIEQETSVSDFEEYKAIHSRLQNISSNPYYKVNYGVPRDVIETDDGQKINYSTYNYVGLNGKKEVCEAAQKAVEKYGTSVSGSRMISGEIDLHRKLENAITEFLGTEDTIVYIGGYTTNVSAISTIVSDKDLILHDSLSHNSIITGCRLSGAKRMSFKHNDMESLEDALKRVRKFYRRVLIVVEGVYSMDGDICKLPQLIELKKKYGALLMVDEAHSLGTIGDCGRGVGSYYNVDRKDVDLWMGTMSKSLASCGGYISGSKEIVELLKYTSDGFMFSVGISPANAAAALEALNILKNSPELVEKLEHNSKFFLEAMKEKGLDTGLAEGTAVVPCIIKDSNKCMEISQKLYKKGINVMPIVYPAVSEEEARLRFFISSEHTEEEMRYTVDVLARML